MKIDAQKLKKIICEKGESIKGLAEKSGVSRVTLNNILKGNTTTTKMAIVGSIAKALGVEIEDFAS